MAVISIKFPFNQQFISSIFNGGWNIDSTNWMLTWALRPTPPLNRRNGIICFWAITSLRYLYALRMCIFLIAWAVSLVFLKWTRKYEPRALHDLVGFSGSVEYFVISAPTSIVNKFDNKLLMLKETIMLSFWVSKLEFFKFEPMAKIWTDIHHYTETHRFSTFGPTELFKKTYRKFDSQNGDFLCLDVSKHKFRNSVNKQDIINSCKVHGFMTCRQIFFSALTLFGGLFSDLLILCSVPCSYWQNVLW